MHIKCLAQCLPHSKCSININIYDYCLVYLKITGFFSLSVFCIFIIGHFAELLIQDLKKFFESLGLYFWSKDLFHSINTGIRFLLKQNPLSWNSAQCLCRMPQGDVTWRSSCHFPFALSHSVRDHPFIVQTSVILSSSYWLWTGLLWPDGPSETCRPAQPPGPPCSSSPEKGIGGLLPIGARHFPDTSLPWRSSQDFGGGLTSTTRGLLISLDRILPLD